MNLLVTFYEGTRPDHRGRSLSEILQWDADELEGCHDYIQMLFPLPEISDFNWNAPIIDREVWKEFRSRLDLRLKLRESFEKILWFYGFVLQTEGGIEVKELHNLQGRLQKLTGMYFRFSKAPIIPITVGTGICDSTTTTSESPESFDPFGFLALKTKP